MRYNQLSDVNDDVFPKFLVEYKEPAKQEALKNQIKGGLTVAVAVALYIGVNHVLSGGK